MPRFHFGLLGGAIGLFSALVIPSFGSIIGWHTALPGFLLGLVVIWLRGKTNWWRYGLALLLCSLGYPLAFFAGFGTMLLVFKLSSSTIALVLALLLSLALSGAIGGALVAFAWSVLCWRWSSRVLIQSLWFGSVLALPFVIVPFLPMFLTIWCAGILLLASSWADQMNNGTHIQPQLQT